MFYTTLIMNEKDLKSCSYLFRKNNKKTADVNKKKTEDLQTTEHLSNNKNKLEVCSFVKKCSKKPQENSNGDFNSNQEILQPSMFIKFKIIMFIWFSIIRSLKYKSKCYIISL